MVGAASVDSLVQTGVQTGSADTDTNWELPSCPVESMQSLSAYMDNDLDLSCREPTVSAYTGQWLGPSRLSCREPTVTVSAYTGQCVL